MYASARCQTACLAIVVALAVSQAQAQGTAAAPSTEHWIDPSTNVVWIGGPNDPVNGPDPMPIDLDPNGLPWRKGISTGPNGTFNGGTLQLSETILNAGDEPWTDWHEIDAQIGSHGTQWGDIIDVRVNGSSISYDSTITPTTIDIFNFSPPVLPGDVLEIDKILIAVTDNVAGPNTLVASILEYPTIPEPSTLATVALGGLAMAGTRRRQC